ncbi:hypothetical protein C9374_001149 [Naegleria lovaniensis]|uniref:DUF1565 domain-containing protein n=1 Tax=Naegleria lovaniensis TaxID=51637 RepID=A0AA88GVB1_NAELO|nr:uncharacterized protein C9374_001149 [Naegleria lovaniensis]KAG2387555.1 hypothetical protein C9374_001149 [Naegleria lovaniensis]
MSRSWFLVECSALLILLLVNLSSSSVLASTFYLSPSGSDSNNGQSVSTPWMTFNKAFTTMKGGDELVLLDGTYSVAAGTGIINWQGSNSAQPPSGTSLNAPTSFVLKILEK